MQLSERRFHIEERNQISLPCVPCVQIFNSHTLNEEKTMSNNKFVVFLSLLAVLSMLLSACGPTTSTEEAAGGLICVIVPGVENPFFGSMQEIAGNRAEEHRSESLKLVHNDDANK